MNIIKTMLIAFVINQNKNTSIRVTFYRPDVSEIKLNYDQMKFHFNGSWSYFSSASMNDNLFTVSTDCVYAYLYGLYLWTSLRTQYVKCTSKRVCIFCYHSRYGPPFHVSGTIGIVIVQITQNLLMFNE